jgi:hypothetical protein
MDGYNQMEAAADAANRTEEEAQRNHERNSRARLHRVMTTKMRTSFIGALSAVEQSFGELWRSSKDVNSDRWRQVWETCRGLILNNGNTQLRAVESELLQYTVGWNRCQKTLVVEEDV